MAAALFAIFQRAAQGGFAATMVKGGQPAGNLDMQMLANDRATITVSNLDELRREMRQVAPDMYKEFKRDATKLGRPFRDDVKKTLRKIQSPPLGPRKVNSSKPWATAEAIASRQYDGWVSSVGRISWGGTGRNYTNAQDTVRLNFKDRREGKNLAKLRSAQDGTISLVRVLVVNPATIIADIAGRKNNARNNYGRGRTNDYFGYQFGRPGRQSHKISPEAVDKFIANLNRVGIQRRASRFAWPTAEKHLPEYKKNVTEVMNEYTRRVNRILES